MLSRIKPVAGVEQFAKLLVEDKSKFHPDDNFTLFVNYKTGKPTYTVEEAEHRNNLMEQCFEICEKKEQDIYAVIYRIFLAETSWSKQIPFLA